MALYSLVDKPKWLTSTQKASTAATAGGWVYTRPDGTAETLVAINRMTTKMIPTVRNVVTAEDAYEVGTATVIDFTVYFNRNIKSSDITSATVLNFLIDESEFTATYRSKTSTSATFRYTFPSNGDEYDIPEASAIGLDSITLNTGEHIYLDFADSNISADLTLPETIDVPVTQKVPEISGITTNKASYVIGTDSTITFTVAFDRKIKSADITSASVLTFTIDGTEYEATYLSKTSTAASFRYTVPSNGDEYEIPEDTEIGLSSITLNTDEHIYLDFSLDDIDADLTIPEATVASSVAQKVPAITGVTTDKASYTIGSDTEVEFTVTFDRDVKSSGLTSATTLDFTINTTHSFTAAYTSVSGNDVVFTWTIPDPYTGGATSTTIALDSITLNTDEYIILDSTVNTVNASFTALPASINVTITVP